MGFLRKKGDGFNLEGSLSVSTSPDTRFQFSGSNLLVIDNRFNFDGDGNLLIAGSLSIDPDTRFHFNGDNLLTESRWDSGELASGSILSTDSGNVSGIIDVADFDTIWVHVQDVSLTGGTLQFVLDVLTQNNAVLTSLALGTTDIGGLIKNAGTQVGSVGSFTPSGEDINFITYPIRPQQIQLRQIASGTITSIEGGTWSVSAR